MHSLSQTRTQEAESLKTQMTDLQKRYQDGIKVNIYVQHFLGEASVNWKLLF